MKIDCGLKHSFCAQCIVNLCKITRIKKGLVHRFKYQDAIKCPQCYEIILIEKETIKEAKYLESCQKVKNQLRESKKEALGISGESKTHTADGKVICRMCIQSLQKNPLPATFQCLTCRNLVMCTQCKGKHKSNHKIVAYLTPKDINRLKADSGEILSGLSTVDLACPDHRYEFYTKFCFTDNMPICAKCAATQPINELDYEQIKNIEN